MDSNMEDLERNSKE